MENLIHWLVTGVITVLCAGLWFWIKRFIHHQDRLHEEWARGGGIMTQEKFNDWCANRKISCPTCPSVKRICEWRNGMFEKGGALTKDEHTLLCKEIVRETMLNITEKLDQLFEHHREWVGQELRLLRTEIAKDRRMDNNNNKQ